MQSVACDHSLLLEQLGKGVAIPAQFYTDPGIVDLELQKVLARSWQYIGPSSNLKNVGDYITGKIGLIPVVVLRSEQGIEGFVNVCRHRRHEVLSGCGNTKLMQCPYHAWTYDLEGNLKAAPRSDSEDNFNLQDYPLLKVQVGKLGPWIFANADPDCIPLQECYGKVLDQIAKTGIDVDNLELHSSSQWRSGANWKTMLENFLECYHCPVAHPGFSAAIDVHPENYELTSSGMVLSQVGFVREKALSEPEAAPYDLKGAVRQAQFHLLWPNFTISINPGFPNLSVDVWLPDGPNAARGFSQQFFAPGVDEAWAQDLAAFNEKVGLEDDRLTDSVQQSLLGGTPETGRLLLKSEHLIARFQELLINALFLD